MLTNERINELAWVARSAGPDVMDMVCESIRQAVIEAEKAEREACATWYAEKGWLLDEGDVPDAIRKRDAL